MSNEDSIQVEGRVVEALPNSLFRVELANGHRMLAHVSGRMRLSFAHIVCGDAVTVQLSPYDLSKGCIVFKEN